MVDAVRTPATSVYFNETTRRFVSEGRRLEWTLVTTETMCCFLKWLELDIKQLQFREDGIFTCGY
jgi:hypothetical protein